MRSRRFCFRGLALSAFVVAASQVVQAQDISASARMAALEARVTALEDAQNIERLFRAYGYYFDKGLWKETTTLFTDDADVEIAQRGVYRGRKSIQRLYVQLFGKGRNCLPPNGLNNHMILQPVMTVNADGKSASGRARILGMLAIRDNDFMLQEGLYNLQFRKDDGIWRIRSLHYFGDIYAIIPNALKQYVVPQSTTSSDIAPDSPPSVQYKSYPGYYLPEFPYPNPVTGQVVDTAQCNSALASPH